MSGEKYTHYGERVRCPIHGNGRRLSLAEIGEIRRAVDIANSKARRHGLKPKGAKIHRFSCTCNCFSVDVQ